MTILGYLGMGFLGFWVGVIITCVILVKKNGRQYAELQKQVRNEKKSVFSEENAESVSDGSNSDSAVSSDDEKTEA
jgi:hypothetical protein